MDCHSVLLLSGCVMVYHSWLISERGSAGVRRGVRSGDVGVFLGIVETVWGQSANRY
jgi:hypothetical protein